MDGGKEVGDRLFTVDEANALIPKLELIMGKLQRHSLVLREQVGEVARVTGQDPDDVTTTQVLDLRPELRSVVEELETLLGEIDACGAHLKGLDLGLVDFPAEMEGEVVLLCWQYGEKEIEYYHPFDGGFAARKPLDPSRERPRQLQ
jgi:hypothetical protein